MRAHWMHAATRAQISTQGSRLGMARPALAQRDLGVTVCDAQGDLELPVIQEPPPIGAQRLSQKHIWIAQAGREDKGTWASVARMKSRSLLLITASRIAVDRRRRSSDSCHHHGVASRS